MVKEMYLNDQVLLELTKLSVDQAADAIFWLNKEGRLIYANKAVTKHLGYGIDGLLKKEIFEIDPYFSKENWKNHWSQICNKKRMAIESVHLGKDGCKIPVEVMLNYLALDDIELLCVSIRNISERKRNETNLIKSENRLRKTLDATSDGVWDRNLKTGEVYYGAKWATVLGYQPEDLQNGKINWERLLHSDDRERAVRAVRDHLSGKTPHYEAEFRLLNNDNEYQWIHARGKIIEYDCDGKPARFVGTHTDITWRKQLEASILKKSEETKMFAYSVIHDLKNPAIVIKGLATRFRKKISELSKSKMLLYCDKMVESSNQIADLVEKINSFIIAKETPAEIEDVRVKDIIRASRDEFAAQLQFRSILWQEFHENPTIRMDRVAILRVMRNFIENSLKYGGDQLSTITIGYQNTPGFHVLSVKDDGVGMSEEDSARIFEPFERKANSVKQEGAGLGLAIVKEIAHLHKGEVWLEPSQKRGVHFCFAISKGL